MKNHLWLIALTLILSACGPGEIPDTTLLPLDEAAWPTPQPTAIAPSPTPFPKISLADLGTPTPTPAISLLTDGVEPTTEPKPVPSAEAFSTYEPIAQAQITALNVRQGPGASYGRVGVLEKGDEVTVLGVNPTGDWAYIRSPNPHLVFQLASGGDIMVINPDGSGLRRLTSGIDPALSPDGQTVAFTRWQGDNGSLWTIHLDGTNEHQILGFTRQARGPAWSPDGQQIVLNYQHEGQLHSRTKCFDLSEGDPPNPPANATGYLDRHDDPKIKIDIKSRTQVDVDFCWKLPPDPHWGLRVINVADGKFEDVDGGTYAFRPAWDPAQPWRIISDGGLGLVEADIKQKTARRLTSEVGDSSPTFSPDGRYLAVLMDQAGGTDIFRLNADGSGRVRLTKTPLWVTAMPDKAKPWNHVAPTWSPDGSQIAF